MNIPTITFSTSAKKAIAADIVEKDNRLSSLDFARQAGDPRLRPVQPSARKLRRIRHADAVATAKKSRRAAFRQQQVNWHHEQNLRGVARVYFGKTIVPPAMFENVEQHVEQIAEHLSRRDGLTFGKARKQVEERLLEIHAAYGDDL